VPRRAHRRGGGGNRRAAGDPRDRRRRLPGHATVRRQSLSSGLHPLLRSAPGQSLRHSARRHCALGGIRAEHFRGRRQSAGADALSLGHRQRQSGDPQPRGRLEPRAGGGAGLARAARGARAVARSAAGRLPAGGLSAQSPCARGPRRCPRSGRRRGRRHSALRAHHGRRHPLGDHALRARRRARPARGHALRRVRRSGVAAHRNARLRNRPSRHAGTRHRLAPHLDARHGQLLRVEDPAAHAGGGRQRRRQPAHQYHPAGPPRRVPQAPWHDPGERDGRARHQRLVRPRLRHGSVVRARYPRHAGGRAHGTARRPHDRGRRDARLLRRRDPKRRTYARAGGLWTGAGRQRGHGRSTGPGHHRGPAHAPAAPAGHPPRPHHRQHAEIDGNADAR
jgi:hypothetical protein